jgi:hypothetical protein
LPPATEPAAALLVAVTPEAEYALGDRRDVRLTHFPFKFGRESRLSQGVFALLKVGDDIKVGGEATPYVFRFSTTPER